MKLIEPLDNAGTRGARKQALEEHMSMFPPGWLKRALEAANERAKQMPEWMRRDGVNR